MGIDISFLDQEEGTLIGTRNNYPTVPFIGSEVLLRNDEHRCTDWYTVERVQYSMYNKAYVFVTKTIH